MESDLLNNIQFGFDIATSATIFGALASWMYESRKKAKKELQVGIHERAKSVSLEKIQKIQYEFEDAFGELVQRERNFSSTFRGAMTLDDPIERIIRDLKRTPELVIEKKESLSDVMSAVDSYYELIQKRRYSLIPILDSMKDGKEFIEAISEDIDQIGEKHREIGNKWHGLLSELIDLDTYRRSLVEGEFTGEDDGFSEVLKKLLSDEKFRNKIHSILFDEDYLKWTKMFVSNENEILFEEAIGNAKESMTDIEQEALISMVCLVIENIEKCYAQVLFLVSRLTQEARVECKDIPIKLSALTYILLANKDYDSWRTIVEKYESEAIFGKDSVVW